METKIIFIFILWISSPIQSVYERMVSVKPVVNLRTAPVDIEQVIFPASSTNNPYQGSQLLFGDTVAVKRQFIDKMGQIWLYVNAIEQERFADPVGWHGFPGWVKQNELIPMPSDLEHNAFVKQYVAPVYDHLGHLMFWFSAGTRLNLQPSDQEFWYKINMANDQCGFIHADGVHHKQNNIDQNVLRMSIVQLVQQFLGSFYCWGGRSAQHDSYGLSGVDCSGLINLVFGAHDISIPRTAHD